MTETDDGPLWRVADVRKHFGCSAMWIYRKQREQGFPRPRKFGGIRAARFWRRDEVLGRRGASDRVAQGRETGEGSMTALSPDTLATLHKRRRTDKIFHAYVAKFGSVPVAHFDDEMVAAMEQSLAMGEDLFAAQRQTPCEMQS